MDGKNFMKRKNNKKWDFAISLGLVNLQGDGDRENFTITALFWVLQSRCIGAKFYNFDVTSGPADRTNLNKKRGEKQIQLQCYSSLHGSEKSE